MLHSHGRGSSAVAALLAIVSLFDASVTASRSSRTFFALFSLALGPLALALPLTRLVRFWLTEKHMYQDELTRELRLQGEAANIDAQLADLDGQIKQVSVRG